MRNWNHRVLAVRTGARRPLEWPVSLCTSIHSHIVSLFEHSLRAPRRRRFVGPRGRSFLCSARSSPAPTRRAVAEHSSAGILAPHWSHAATTHRCSIVTAALHALHVAVSPGRWMKSCIHSAADASYTRGISPAPHPHAALAFSTVSVNKGLSGDQKTAYGSLAGQPGGTQRLHTAHASIVGMCLATRRAPSSVACSWRWRLVTCDCASASLRASGGGVSGTRGRGSGAAIETCGVSMLRCVRKWCIQYLVAKYSDP